MDANSCPNCGTNLKGGLIGSIKLVEEQKKNLINEYSITKSAGYCTKCSKQPYEESLAKYNEELNSLHKKIQQLIVFIPIVSIQSPHRWEYEVIGLVTGQSVTGTGVISEFTSSITDMFGEQSGRYNKKIKNGELLCANQLRKQTLDIRGNAIIATDVDYAELGGDKGMIMVCMTGTAIRLTNPEVLGDSRVSRIVELVEANKREQFLSTLKSN
jgi:uncharacterized protein YbjQ (UPF0145 family)